MNKYTSAVTILAISTLFTGTYSEQSRAEGPSEQETAADNKENRFDTLNARYSYAYGADLAGQFKAEGVELNVDIMAEAMQDVFEGDDRRMSAGEIAATIDIYMEIHEKQKEAEMAVTAEKNKKAGEAFLAENATQEGVVVTETGLQYRIINEGNDGYKPTRNDEVTVHYRGMLVDGTEFDSTHKRNEPYTVKVKQLIPGWAEALQRMSEGAKWELYLPADIAYGEEGSEPYVGPNAALIFEVEVLEIEKARG